MAEQKTLSGSLEMRYVPDEYTEKEKAEGANWPLGAGYWDLGFVADGAFFVLRRVHGGEVDKLLALAKERKDAQAQAPAEPTPPPTTPPPEQPQPTTPGPTTTVSTGEPPPQ